MRRRCSRRCRSSRSSPPWPSVGGCQALAWAALLLRPAGLRAGARVGRARRAPMARPACRAAPRRGAGGSGGHGRPGGADRPDGRRVHHRRPPAHRCRATPAAQGGRRGDGGGRCQPPPRPPVRSSRTRSSAPRWPRPACRSFRNSRAWAAPGRLRRLLRRRPGRRHPRCASGGPQLLAAAATFLATQVFDQLFLVVNELPATVPPAVVMLALDAWRRWDAPASSPRLSRPPRAHHLAGHDRQVPVRLQHDQVHLGEVGEAALERRRAQFLDGDRLRAQRVLEDSTVLEQDSQSPFEDPAGSPAAKDQPREGVDSGRRTESSPRRCRPRSRRVVGADHRVLQCVGDEEEHGEVEHVDLPKPRLPPSRSATIRKTTSTMSGGPSPAAETCGDEQILRDDAISTVLSRRGSRPSSLQPVVVPWRVLVTEFAPGREQQQRGEDEHEPDRDEVGPVAAAGKQHGDREHRDQDHADNSISSSGAPLSRTSRSGRIMPPPESEAAVRPGRRLEAGGAVGGVLI